MSEEHIYHLNSRSCHNLEARSHASIKPQQEFAGSQCSGEHRRKRQRRLATRPNRSIDLSQLLEMIRLKLCFNIKLPAEVLDVLAMAHWVAHPYHNPKLVVTPEHSNRITLKRYSRELENSNILSFAKSYVDAKKLLGRSTKISGDEATPIVALPLINQPYFSILFSESSQGALSNGQSCLSPATSSTEPGNVDVKMNGHTLQAVLGRTQGNRTRVLISRDFVPLTSKILANEAATVFRDIFKVYRDIYEKMGIMHGNICFNNIHIRRDAAGQIHGVLKDYDLALTSRDNTFKCSQYPPYTERFLALDLSPKREKLRPSHRYRHDLESLFYVIVFSAHDAVEFSIYYPKDTSFSIKWSMLSRKMWGYSAYYYRSFARFESWTVAMNKLILDGYLTRLEMSGRNKDPSAADLGDIETLGGHLTFDAFESVMRIPIEDVETEKYDDHNL